jgi:hypothetical protein
MPWVYVGIVATPKPNCYAAAHSQAILMRQRYVKASNGRRREAAAIACLMRQSLEGNIGFMFWAAARRSLGLGWRWAFNQV